MGCANVYVEEKIQQSQGRGAPRGERWGGCVVVREKMSPLGLWASLKSPREWMDEGQPWQKSMQLTHHRGQALKFT